MVLFILNHKFRFEIENLCRVFYPNTDIKLAYEYSDVPGDRIITRVDEENCVITASVQAQIGESNAKDERTITSGDDSKTEYTLALCLFTVLKQLTGYTPAWGMLTGVRPSKLMNTLIDEMGQEAAKSDFVNRLLVSPKKTELAADVTLSQADIIKSNKPNSFSLYVSIPFCPSRCSYCSFVSHSITAQAAKKLFEPYLEKLAGELALTGKLAAQNGLRLESVYFGGGTPGILSAEQSEMLIKTISDNFDLSTNTEYTFESGRADTVTQEKLLVLAKNGVDRISINPQTFNDAVLENIGRKHTAAQAVEAYGIARNVGFDSVNMDLIAGLPGESVESFMNSVDTAISLKPENITVHALALKRSSRLVAEENARLAQDDNAAKMVDYSNSALSRAGYIPYYMYRQSRCVGNLENVGWCLPGKQCKYNIYMMEEIHTVLAAGAGAVTKLKAPDGNHIERIFNFKYPYEYNARFDELMERKGRITQFYSTYN